VKERVPDEVVSEADQIVNIDLPAEDLQERLNAGKIYRKSASKRRSPISSRKRISHASEMTLSETIISRPSAKGNRRRIGPSQRRRSSDGGHKQS
jgi:hypothetical protein